MRFRQVHLDFHTSPLIPAVGEKFDRRQWQRTLQDAAVDSITLFATCHHGYAYYDTAVGKRHPHLGFDLLRAQLEACHQIGVKTPVYLSAGLNDYASSIHPEWGEMSAEGRLYDPLCAHFHKMCFNSPYLDFLCDQIREVLGMFPDIDGIFTDIIFQGECCCRHCIKGMLDGGLDPQNPADRRKFADQVLMKYYRRTYEAVKSVSPEMPLFHNSGHVTIGSEEVLKYFSHLELESLPTGGWGYDHFPMSAAYVRNLGMEFLGMTGKFHTTWGEFGGYKPPEALRYECAAMLANGAKCSVGDQLHPCGMLDEGTYRIIGQAYREVRDKEPWCDHVESAAAVAILSGLTPERPPVREMPGDAGASRILLESHIPFDIVDTVMDWSRYRILLLPDEVRLSAALAERLEKFLANGGRLIMSGTSGMKTARDEFALPMPFDHEGVSPYRPDYVKPSPRFAPECLVRRPLDPSGTSQEDATDLRDGTPDWPFVMYLPSQRIRKRGGVSLGQVYDPYFNRDFRHFCSHQHTPPWPEPSGYDAGVMTGNILYFAHPVFSIYRAYGAVVLKEYVAKAMRRFIGDDLQVEAANLPSQGRITLMSQPRDMRYVLHVLYANTILRGGVVELAGGTTSGRAAIEVIEDLNPAGPVRISLKLDRKISGVRIVPEGRTLPFSCRNGRIEFTIPQFTCHCMVELAFGQP